MSRMTIAELLAVARCELQRLDVATAWEAMREGAVLIDIRPEDEISAGGRVPGALVIGRNVLEWRLDPDSGARHPEGPGLDDQVILMCEEGYQSSLAAVILKRLGFRCATDLIGGFGAWRDAGLPVEPSVRPHPVGSAGAGLPAPV